jgi:hypothetical protein
MKRLACALVLIGVASALAIGPSDARAAPRRVADDIQLSIITPDPSSIGDRISLDVSFRGSPVETIELYLDNALVAKRQLSSAQTRGIVTFTVDTVLLAEGAHDILVKASTPTGKTVSAHGKLRISVADLSAPVRIAYPPNGIQVSGTVQIRAALDPSIQKLNPYVTFFVDKEFKSLRNFPPYEYIWDTTKVVNGWHMLEVWTTTGDTSNPYKSRPTHVHVNNPTGETKKLDKIEDLRQQDAPKHTLDLQPEIPKAKKPTPKVPKLAPTPMVKEPPVVLQTAPKPEPAKAAANKPNALIRSEGATTLPAPNPTDLPTVVPRIPEPTPRISGGAISQPSERMAIASAPRALLPGLGQPTPLYPVISPQRSDTGTITVQPGETTKSIGDKMGVKPQEIARLNNLRHNGRLEPGRPLIVPRMGAFDVAFDGDLIAFDVPPRIEDGIRLAPFRQIFEHTGGRLYWFGGQARTVRAVNDRREIEIKIGNPNAIVNNRIIPMERRPYIDSGRTIVPLSFIRDSLDVTVSFNAKTGRLLIESKK